MTKRIEVNVVAFQEGDLWVAQCVEYDIAAFAKSLPELPRAFERAVAANLCANADLGRRDLESVPVSPPHFKAMFDAAQLDVKPTEKPTAGQRLPVTVRHLRVAEAA